MISPSFPCDQNDCKFFVIRVKETSGGNSRFIVKKSNFSSWLWAFFVLGAMLSSWAIYFDLYFALHLEVSILSSGQKTWESWKVSEYSILFG